MSSVYHEQKKNYHLRYEQHKNKLTKTCPKQIFRKKITKLNLNQIQNINKRNSDTGDKQ